MAKLPALLDDAGISRLAREVARDIKELPDILATFKLTDEQFDRIVDSKFFQTRLNEEVQLWNASDAPAINKRIETKAATMVEDCLLEVYALVHDREQPLAAKVEALKWAARMAGLGEAKTGASDGGGVKITINVGGQELKFDKEKVNLPPRVTDVVDLTPDKT